MNGQPRWDNLGDLGTDWDPTGQPYDYDAGPNGSGSSKPGMGQEDWITTGQWKAPPEMSKAAGEAYAAKLTSTAPAGTDWEKIAEQAAGVFGRAGDIYSQQKVLEAQTKLAQAQAQAAARAGKQTQIPVVTPSTYAPIYAGMSRGAMAVLVLVTAVGVGFGVWWLMKRKRSGR